MGNTTQKVYQLTIELGQAEQNLANAGKLLGDLKSKSQAANAEAKEAQAIYRENATALKELVSQQKQLQTAQAKSAPGEAWLSATAALDKNLAAQKRLNVVVEESRIDYLGAKEAAAAAGAAVGQQSTAVKDLSAGMKEYKTQAAEAAKEFAPGTFGAISAEVTDLKARLLDLAPGSVEAAQAIQQLGDKQSAMRQLANATAAANPRAQARAFQVLSGALLGLTGVATTAMQVFGLSDATAQKYGQAIQGVVSVLYSAEQINKLLNNENRALISSIWAGAKAWLGFGAAAEEGAVAAETGLKGVKIGIAETGIGLLVLAIGALVGLWMQFGSTVSSSESTFTKFKAAVVGGWDAMIAGVKAYYKFWWQVLTLDWSGAAATFKKSGADMSKAYQDGATEVVAAAHREEIKREVEHRARLIEIIKAKGEDALKMEIYNAQRKLLSMARSNQEEKDAYEEQVKELANLRIQLRLRTEEREKAERLANLQGLAAIEESEGKNAFARQMAAKEAQIHQQLDADLRAGQLDSAAFKQLLAEKQAMQNAYDKQMLERSQAAQLSLLDARISLQKAKGREAFSLEVARAQQELAFLKQAAWQNQAEIIAAQARIADMKAARQVELTERAHAAELAGLDASIALQKAKGEDSYEAEVAREERQLQFLRQAGIVSLAAVRQQLGKIAAMKAAHQVKEEADERAAELARQQARINFLKAAGEDTTELELNLKVTELATLLRAAQKNAAAIIAKQGEIDALIEQQRVKTEQKRRARMVEDFENELKILEIQGKDTLALRIAFAKKQVALDTDTSEKGLERLRADTQKLKELEAEMIQRVPDLGSTLLQKIFGVKPEDVQRVKEVVTRAVSEISQSVGQLASSLLDAAKQENEQALETAQQQLQDANQALTDSQSKAEATAQALVGAAGARRDYLLRKLQAERTETDRLAAAKAKAAAEEKRQLEEKHRLEKISAELSAASALATNVAAAASAVYAGVKAIEKGSDNPWPLNLAAIASGLAAVIAAVASAKQLSTATKMADGGIIDGGSHASGNDVPVFGGRVRVEGGEFIAPVDATQNNRQLLEMIRTTGRRRTLTVADIATIGKVRVQPAPQSYYADGGILSRGTGGGYASANEVSNLRNAQEQTNTLLALLVESNATAANAAIATAGHTAATADHTGAIKEQGPAPMVFGYEEQIKFREQEHRLTQSESFRQG